MNLTTKVNSTEENEECDQPPEFNNFPVGWVRRARLDLFESSHGWQLIC